MANFTFQANRCGTQECGAISVNCLTPCPSISAIIIVKNDYSGGCGCWSAAPHGGRIFRIHPGFARAPSVGELPHQVRWRYGEGAQGRLLAFDGEIRWWSAGVLRVRCHAAPKRRWQAGAV